MSIARYNKIEGMQPYLHARINRILSNMRMLGFDPILFETYRTKERQWYLLGAGRTPTQLRKFGIPWKYCKIYSRPKSKRVTYTANSKHLVGKAADIISKKYLWSSPRFFTVLIALAKQEGFKSLSFEKCHVEWS